MSQGKKKEKQKKQGISKYETPASLAKKYCARYTKF
jgi:hypothetical protein